MATRMLQRRGTSLEWSTLNPILSDGELGYERDTKILKIGDGVTSWILLDGIQADFESAFETIAATYVSRDVVNAAGDILVGTGPDTVSRLPKGTNGQHLVVSSGGVLAWETQAAPDLSSRVARVGDNMSGDLNIIKNDAALLLQETATDRIKMQADTNQQYIQVDDELHVCGIGSTVSSTPKPVRAGAIYDTGNRVYSASNPPPPGGSMIYRIIRGTGSGSNGDFDIAIPNVNINMTETRLLGVHSATEVYIQLISSTILRVNISGTTATVSYELTEWANA